MPDDVIDKLDRLVTEGNSLDEALTIIRGECVPPGYTPAPWNPEATCETPEEKMKSIVLTFRFRKEVARLKVEKGRDFTHSVYVPEVDHTGSRKHSRADHNHLLKRIASHTRDGGPHQVDVRKFECAAKDSSTNLTMATLLGDRKQSTRDAEKLLSHTVANYFQTKGYNNEAKYVRTVADWHAATDGRGLDQQERKLANETMLDMIMVEWMPWYKTNADLSLIDVNV